MHEMRGGPHVGRVDRGKVKRKQKGDSLRKIILCGDG